MSQFFLDIRSWIWGVRTFVIEWERGVLGKPETRSLDFMDKLERIMPALILDLQKRILRKLVPQKNEVPN